MEQNKPKMKLGQTIYINSLEDTPGKILAIIENSMGRQYEIRYFIEGKACLECFFEDELNEKKTKNKSTGYLPSK